MRKKQDTLIVTDGEWTLTEEYFELATYAYIFRKGDTELVSFGKFRPREELQEHLCKVKAVYENL